MKCTACGYEDNHAHVIDMDAGLNTANIPSVQPFIVMPSMAYNEVSDGTNYARVAVKLYACPKCKTVRLGD